MMLNIKENIEEIVKTLPEGVRLIAVSKTKPVEYIEEAYAGDSVLSVKTGHRKWLLNTGNCPRISNGI